MDPDLLCMSCMSDSGGAAVCPACGASKLGFDRHGLFLAPRSVLRERYLLGKVLGHGGFGVTYLGWDLTLRAKLAVKEYFPRDFATRATDRQKIVAFGGEDGEHFKCIFRPWPTTDSDAARPPIPILANQRSDVR